MNERIQKLAEQAGIEYTGKLKIFKNDDGSISSGGWEFPLEKFAELIIRECADIADCAEPYRSSDLILKKFGVK